MAGRTSQPGQADAASLGHPQRDPAGTPRRPTRNIRARRSGRGDRHRRSAELAGGVEHELPVATPFGRQEVERQLIEVPVEQQQEAVVGEPFAPLPAPGDALAIEERRDRLRESVAQSSSVISSPKALLFSPCVRPSSSPATIIGTPWDNSSVARMMRC